MALPSGETPSAGEGGTVPIEQEIMAVKNRSLDGRTRK